MQILEIVEDERRADAVCDRGDLFEDLLRIHAFFDALAAFANDMSASGRKTLRIDDPNATGLELFAGKTRIVAGGRQSAAERYVNDIVTLLDERTKYGFVFVDIHRRRARECMPFIVVLINLFMGNIDAVEIFLSVQAHMNMYEIDVVTFGKFRTDVAGTVRDKFHWAHNSNPPD